VLPVGEAVTFLESRAGRRDQVGACTLAEALGRLPLALDHTAAFCKRTGMSFAAYVAKASSLLDSAPRGAAYPRSVAATFDLAIGEAVKQCPAAEALMAFLAFCAPERIPSTLVEGAIDDEGERMAALAALAELSLIKHDPFEDSAPAVTVHRLVQAVARARSEAKDMAQTAVTRLIARLSAIYPRDGYSHPTSWPSCAELTPHLLAICETETADTSTTIKRAELLNRAASYFHGRAFYSEARMLFERALAIGEKALGPVHPDTAMILNNLALVLKDQGCLAEARGLYERALAILERAFGPDHPELTGNLHNLAVLVQAQGHLGVRDHSSSGRLRSAKGFSAQSIPKQQASSIASGVCF
jgi:tetratricopeptide (TPR) repeat protein